MNYKEEKDKLIRNIVDCALKSGDVCLMIDVVRLLKEVSEETPDYSDVLKKFKKMKKAEDGTKVVVKSDLRRLINGN